MDLLLCEEAMFIQLAMSSPAIQNQESGNVGEDVEGPSTSWEHWIAVTVGGSRKRYVSLRGRHY